MKALDIAIKDLRSSFRSWSALVFMFGVPLLVTGMFYVMFGGMRNGSDFAVPATRVVVANLDAGSPDFAARTANLPSGASAASLGEIVETGLESPDLADLLTVASAPDAAAARMAVDRREAGVAIILPADFTQQFEASGGQAVLELYADPTLTLGPAVVQSVLARFMDDVAGAKIAVHLVQDSMGSANQAQLGQVLQRYLAQPAAAAAVEVHSPGQPADPRNNLLTMVGPIMAGMLVFYAFFTGASSAQSIVREEERRTLPRLFTTPTPQGAILSGKLLAVFLTVLVQVATLLVAARLLFGIQWGGLAAVAGVALGAVLCAAAFGIFVNSLLKSTRQAGVVFGGVLTLTGMLGMLPIFTLSTPGGAPWAETVALLVPQGWAVRGLFQAMNGASLSQSALSAAGLAAWGAVFFVAGVWRFQKRYA